MYHKRHPCITRDMHVKQETSVYHERHALSQEWWRSGDLRGKDEQGREQDPGLVAPEADREADSETFNPLPLPYPLAQISHGEAKATASHASRAQASCHPCGLEKENSPGVGCWWLCSASSRKPSL